MLDPFLRMNWLFFVHSGAMHLADGGDFDPCMHAHTINHTHRCFHFFPKVGLKFEADHWQVDTSGSHYFIHSHRPMKSRKKSIVIESNCWRSSNIQKHFFQSRDTAKFDFTQAHTTHTTRTTLTSQDICVWHICIDVKLPKFCGNHVFTLLYAGGQEPITVCPGQRRPDSMGVKTYLQYSSRWDVANPRTTMPFFKQLILHVFTWSPTTSSPMHIGCG